MSWLERYRVPKLAGAGLVLLLILGASAAGAYALRDDARELASTLPTAMQRARQEVLSRLDSDTDAVGQATKALGTPAETSDGTVAAGPAAGPSSGSLVERAVGAMFSMAGQLIVIFFLVYFLLISGHHVRNRVIEIAGPDPERCRLTATIIDEINAQIQRYLLVLLVTGTLVGLATWAVLAWIGVQHAATWGILAGVFNSIPYFGPVVVSGGLFLVGMVQGGITQALQMSGIAILITSLEGWLLAPALMGKAERMSPLAVFVGVLLWTWIWGAWGTVLAVPMLVIIKSVADHVQQLRPVGRLMGP